MWPPTSCCLLCKKMLSFHHKPTQIVVHTLTGPYLYSKYIFRFRGCKFASNYNGAFQSQPQDIHYHPDHYGNDKMGWKFYGHLEFRHVRASNEVFIEKNLVEDYLALLHHGWLSSEGNKSKNHLFSIRIMSKKGMLTSVECRWSLETVLSHLVRKFCFMI